MPPEPRVPPFDTIFHGDLAEGVPHTCAHARACARHAHVHDNRVPLCEGLAFEVCAHDVVLCEEPHDVAVTVRNSGSSTPRCDQGRCGIAQVVVEQELTTHGSWSSHAVRLGEHARNAVLQRSIEGSQ